MSNVVINGLVGEAPTTNTALLSWIAENVELFQPDRVVFADGSDAEWDRLTQELVDAGTLIRLNEEKRPNSFLARSNPKDVALIIYNPEPSISSSRGIVEGVLVYF